MPLQKLQLRPGVNRESTTLANEGGWFECDKVRFRSGYPQKLGGWQPISPNTYLGVARSLWNWVTLGGLNLVGLGTNLKFYIEKGGAYFDITPLRSYAAGPVTLNNPLALYNLALMLPVWKPPVENTISLVLPKLPVEITKLPPNELLP